MIGRARVALGLLIALGATASANAGAPVSEGINQLGWGIFQELGRTESGKGVAVSPFSISEALGMTLAGAKGKTEAEILTALHLKKTEGARAQRAFRDLLAKLRDSSQKSYELKVANRAWVQKDFELLDSYLNACEEGYGAKPESLDFVGEPEPSRSRINSWVSDNTAGKINDLIPQGAINATTRLVLTNAVYFKAAWKNPFSKERTKDESFTLSAQAGKRNQKVPVPTMIMERAFRYAESGGMELLELPYADRDLSMIVALPAQGNGNAAKVSYQALSKAIAKLKNYQVEVHLPKFKLHQGFGLKAPLQKLGIRSAFQDGVANLSGMTGKEDLSVSEAVHQAYVDVDEEGTEAAAATGMVVGITSMPAEPPKKVVFKVDRPFLFLIRHEPTGVILFLGRVEDPRT